MSGTEFYSRNTAESATKIQVIMRTLENSCHLASLFGLGFFFFESTIVKVKLGLIFIFSSLLAHDRYPY